MIIEELKTRNNPSITITFTYDEVRDIVHGLYEVTKLNGNDDKRNRKICDKMTAMFDLIKHGNVMDNTIERLYEINQIEKLEKANEIVKTQKKRAKE